MSENVYDIPTVKMDEFQAIGYGGLYLADMEEVLVASMGTGLALCASCSDSIDVETKQCIIKLTATLSCEKGNTDW